MSTGSIKSVSELRKLKPQDNKLALQNAQKFAHENISKIFNKFILSNTPSDIKIKLLKSGQLFYNKEGCLSF
jgi:hypothetical protein